MLKVYFNSVYKLCTVKKNKLFYYLNRDFIFIYIIECRQKHEYNELNNP